MTWNIYNIIRKQTTVVFLLLVNGIFMTGFSLSLTLKTLFCVNDKMTWKNNSFFKKTTQKNWKTIDPNFHSVKSKLSFWFSAETKCFQIIYKNSIFRLLSDTLNFHPCGDFNARFTYFFFRRLYTTIRRFSKRKSAFAPCPKFWWDNDIPFSIFTFRRGHPSERIQLWCFLSSWCTSRFIL